MAAVRRAEEPEGALFRSENEQDAATRAAMKRASRVGNWVLFDDSAGLIARSRDISTTLKGACSNVEPPTRTPQKAGNRFGDRAWRKMVLIWKFIT